MAQQVVGQHHRHHRLGDRRGTDADAWVMPALGAQLHFVAETVDAADGMQDRAGGLHHQPGDDVLAARDAAQNAAGVVAEEHRLAVLHAHLVGILLAAQGGNREAVANLDTLHRVDAHQSLGEVGIELVVDRVAQPHGDARGYDLDDGAAGRAALADIVEVALPGLSRLPIRAPERIVAGRVPAPFAAVDLLRAELNHGAAHLDPVTQDLAGDGACRNPHRRLARRLPAAAAIVAHAVLLEIGVVGVGRPKLVLDLGIVAAAL